MFRLKMVKVLLRNYIMHEISLTSATRFQTVQAVQKSVGAAGQLSNMMMKWQQEK